MLAGRSKATCIKTTHGDEMNSQASFLADIDYHFRAIATIGIAEMPSPLRA
jgi:hypothetical protein